QSHPYVQIYNRINDTFGGGAAVVVGVIPHSGDVFTPATLGKVARITAALEQMPELTGRGSVWSLASGRAKRFAMQDGDLDVRQLMPAGPTRPQGPPRPPPGGFRGPPFVGALGVGHRPTAARGGGLSPAAAGAGRAREP